MKLPKRPKWLRFPKLPKLPRIPKLTLAQSGFLLAFLLMGGAGMTGFCSYLEPGPLSKALWFAFVFCSVVSVIMFAVSCFVYAHSDAIREQ